MKIYRSSLCFLRRCAKSNDCITAVSETKRDHRKFPAIRKFSGEYHKCERTCAYLLTEANRGPHKGFPKRKEKRNNPIVTSMSASIPEFGFRHARVNRLCDISCFSGFDHKNDKYLISSFLYHLQIQVYPE